MWWNVPKRKGRKKRKGWKGLERFNVLLKEPAKEAQRSGTGQRGKGDQEHAVGF